MKIALGCDHGGLNLKTAIKDHLTKAGHEVVDFGTNSNESCDYPLIAEPLAHAVADGECERGILVCGTGIGIGIAANKVDGIRAALCHDTFSARASRNHNNANILTMGDDEAATMGVNARLVRLLVMVAATLVTASSVAISGMIGWVGLVIPHLCRMLVGCDYRKLLPASMVMGAGFLLLVDDVARVATTMEIPIGILTAFVGAPFFLYLITKGRRI